MGASRSSLHSGGIEKHCEEIYPCLAALGCDVTVIARAPYTGQKPYQYRGVHILPIACPKDKYLETIFHTLPGILKARQLRCDILHIHAIGPSLFVPLARLLGLKVVMTHHGPDYERKKWNTIAKVTLKLAEISGVLFAHRVIVISRGIAESVREKFGRETTIIPNGVVVREPVGDEDALKKYNLERGKYILAVGRLVPEKGFDELVESFRQVSLRKDQPHRWKLAIVGDADHEDDFSRRLKKKSGGIADVVLTGFQTGKPLQELYSHAGLFVLPSFHEGLPIALLEALSYGSSCLASDIPPNREVELEEERYFKPGDINLMTSKLREFIDQSDSDDQRRRRIHQVMEKYNWPQIAQKTLRVYKAALAPAASSRFCQYKNPGEKFESKLGAGQKKIRSGL